MPFQRSFAAGEIAPTLYSGADSLRYQEGLATCKNFLVMRHGGVANRAGTPFVVEVKTSANRTWLGRFVFDETDTYILEIGNLYFRFVKQGAQVEVSGVAAWSGVTAYVAGDIVSSAGTNYYCILAHTNQVPPNATYWYALTGAILEVPTPYVTAHLPDLQWSQTGDIVRFTHPSYPPYELRRTSSRWTMAAASYAPSIAAPANLAATAGAGTSLTYAYKVTAVKAETYEESLPSSSDSCACDPPTATDPNTLAWDAVSGSAEYNVYRDSKGNGTFYFLGIAASNSFNDTGEVEEDESLTPPVNVAVFGTTNNYPAAVGSYQQRALYGGTNTRPEEVKASRTGFLNNFSISSPIQDDDAVTFTPVGKRAGFIRHIEEVAGQGVILTSSGAWAIRGEAGPLTPTNIDLKQQNNFGASQVMPAVVGNSLIYVQSRGSLLRDLKFDLTAGSYEGRDLTIFAPHLVEGKTIEQMAYAEVPDSIVWCVRSDGVLLGLTYLREFDRWGWHRHDTNAGADLFESVQTIPEITPTPASGFPGEKDEDSVYVIVKRTIDGSTKRYIEKMASRRVVDYRLDGNFLDSSLSYIGVNALATTVTLSSAGGWTTADEITVTASVASTFAAGDVGNGITVWDTTNLVVTRIVITTFTSDTVVKGLPVDTVPAALRNVATVAWSRAVDEVSGLEHLEGETVTALANGRVFNGLTVASGAVSLEILADIIHVGLPIVADFETLDLDSSDQDGFRDKKKLIKNATLVVLRSRGIYAGGDFDNLQPHAVESGTELGLDIFEESGGSLLEGNVECRIASKWRKSGRVCVRQSEPLPLQILGVIPNGELGG